MKYVSRDVLEQIITAYIEATQSRMTRYKNRDDALRCEGKIQAFEAVIRSLDGVTGIEIEEEAI